MGGSFESTSNKHMTQVIQLEKQLTEFEQTASKSLAEAKTHAQIESIRQEVLGQKGTLTSILRGSSTN